MASSYVPRTMATVFLHVKRCKDYATLATEAEALYRRLQRAWGVEPVGTRRYWRLHGLVTRADGRASARQEAANGAA